MPYLGKGNGVFQPASQISRLEELTITGKADKQAKQLAKLADYPTT